VELATLIAGLVSAAALVGSLLVLARQTGEAARQSALANELAGVRAKVQGVEGIDRVVAYFVDHPELRAYLYDGKEVPDDPTERARVLAVAELMADAMQSIYWHYEGQSVDALRPADSSLDIRSDLDDYAEFILAHSPAVCSLVRDHPRQFQHLALKLAAIEPVVNA
jgi:hypothetical protein